MKTYMGAESGIRNAVRNAYKLNEPRVLVVDDDPASAQALLHVLSNLGLNVTVLFRGRDAVEALRHEPFELFVLDWNMPGFDGGAVIKALGQMVQKSDVGHEIARMPLIVYSGLNEKDLKPPKELNYFHFTDYLQKPSSISEMAALVVSTLTGSRG